MSLKPLYLGNGQDLRVRADGPALRVDGSGRAAGRYPLRRLSRVVSAEDVAWGTNALLACLRAGVPIVFIERDGTPSGWCFGPRRRETTLAGLLREGLDRTDWEPRFDVWRRSVEQSQASAALRSCGLSCVSDSLQAADVSLFNHHRQRCGVGVAAHMCSLRGAASALIARRVDSSIGDASLIGFARPGLHLSEVFVGMMRWQLHSMIGRTSVATLSEPVDMRFAARLVERDAFVLEAATLELLTGFEIWLRDWLL
jgi:hypothetical protein